MAEYQLEDGDDWVVVKKQKITVLVPPASPVRSRIKSSRTNSRAKQLKTKLKKAHSRSRNAIKRFLDYSIPEERKTPENYSVHESQRHKEIAQALRTDRATYPSDCDGVVQAATSVKYKETRNHDLGESVLRQCSTAADCSAGRTKDQLMSNSRFTETLAVRQRLLAGAPSVVNQRIRASNLEKRLERLGGLRRYLASRGLNQFIKIFERQKIDKFQLVNLTMHKLKDMGADAVGPRRKLLYAIDCLCQPYLKIS